MVYAKWLKPHKMLKEEIEAFQEDVKAGHPKKECAIMHIYNNVRNAVVKKACLEILNALDDDGKVVDRTSVFKAYGDIETWWILSWDLYLADDEVWGYQLLMALNRLIWG